MAITDLTNTKWTFKDVLDTEEQTVTYSLEFQSNNENFNFLRLYHTSNFPNEMRYLFSTINNKYVYENGWSLPLYKTIFITGGTDATNSDLITWLQANAIAVESVGGYWRFNSTLTIPEDGFTYYVNFSIPFSGDTGEQLNAIDQFGGALTYDGTNLEYCVETYGGWYEKKARIINITDGDDFYDSDLLIWLKANAKKIELKNLEYTTWEFYDDIIFPSSVNDYEFSLNFISNNISYKKFWCQQSGSNYMLLYKASDTDLYTQVYSSDVWADPSYQTIKISNGDDISDTNLILFIVCNATEIRYPGVSVYYSGSEIDLIDGSETTTLLTGGKYCVSNIILKSNLQNVYVGSSAPSSLLGNNYDIYIQAQGEGVS